MLSTSCQYAIQSILYISTFGEKTPVPAKEIAEKLKLPKEFISKILQSLTKHEIIGSTKGINGGFYINKKTSEIKILDIIKIIDGEDFLEGCVLGFEGCSDENPCPIHQKWKMCKQDLLKLFSNETIDHYEDLVKSKVDYISNLNSN
ncbi:MAG TPA: Rrf2 family transcriptional regulator [Ignavibacteriales bacterium]|nr:Rrf2 family transcriptional regulator [Ignavibacteriales bacterium]HOL80848.1 Rrf2 family transcriptional regulator [Ignavibacteriales bacterium]HOM65874.1 Rrf2 family transcriptional regulator [Ignavibacteriales bacterium]HPD67630.1 Rrf2 family transcriptional regulator [Ignavibacteriales bacterium]HPP33283.1 Rrf2 family transcriptional regulator [Ignavibacteriales bacterium]